MSLALHGHHVLLIATLAFAAAVLTPNWYTSPDESTNLNVFQLCINSSSPRSCQWIFSLQSNNSFSGEIKILYPTLVASFAIACAGLSLIGLLLGSWYIQQHTNDNDAKWLLLLIILITLLSFLLSCGVWVIMLTTNLQQKIFDITNVRLKDFGFSFWINIGSSAAYLYALLIYLITICKD